MNKLKHRAKPYHDLEDCQRLRAAWHEAGHAIIAMMNYDASINWLGIYPYKWQQNRMDKAGYCRLEICGVPSYGNYAELMPLEYFIAGCVAESILTDVCPYDIWDSYMYWGDERDGTGNDKSNFYARWQGTDDEYYELFDRTERMLRKHKKQLRIIAKRLLRKGEIYGWQGGWLHSVGKTLAPMHNPAIDQARSQYQAILDEARAKYETAKVAA
jgi:hypothetical protein